MHADSEARSNARRIVTENRRLGRSYRSMHALAAEIVHGRIFPPDIIDTWKHVLSMTRRDERGRFTHY